MDIKDVLSVGLTAEDFDSLVKGVDAIVEREKAQGTLDAMVGVMVSSLGNAARKNEMDVIFARKIKDLEKKCEAQKEDLVILKSKLILLKRLLLSNAAVSMANEILKNTQPTPNS